MSESEWSRVEGMVIAPGLDPMKLAKELKDRSVVAQIEWFDETPGLVGIRVATDGDSVGTLTKRAKNIRPGLSLKELAEALAAKFEAEVMIGGISVDAIDGDHADLVAGLRSSNGDSPIRIVEIGRTPASAVPLMAAFEGADIAEMDMPGDKRLMAAQLPPHRDDWYFGDVPLVTLTMHGDEFQAFFIDEDDPEGVVTYNWGMTELTIAGAQGWDGAASQTTHALVGSLPDIEAIHDAVPGVDMAAAFEASQLRGPQAVRKFVTALGLPSDIADFLLGVRGIEQISGAKVHHARGISNAIGRSVDILLDEKSEGSKFWDAYTDLVIDQPWLIHLLTAVEASTGTAMIILGRKRDGHRSGLAKTATVIGSLLIIDSLAQNALAKYTARRAHRREQRQNTLSPQQ